MNRKEYRRDKKLANSCEKWVVWEPITELGGTKISGNWSIASYWFGMPSSNVRALNNYFARMGSNSVDPIEKFCCSWVHPPKLVKGMLKRGRRKK